MRFPGYSEAQLDETLEYAQVPFSFPKEKDCEHPVSQLCFPMFYLFCIIAFTDDMVMPQCVYITFVSRTNQDLSNLFKNVGRRE